MAYNTSDRKDTLLATMYFHYIQRSKSAQQISAAIQSFNWEILEMPHLTHFSCDHPSLREL